MNTQRWLFLRKFLQYGTQIASIAPSSPQLAQALCSQITPHQPQVILELGAGDGAVTDVAARRMHPQSRLISIELDPEFASLTQQRVPQATVIHGDAGHAAHLLDTIGITALDLIISGLPMPSLPPSVVRAILDLAQQRCPSGVFSQLTVMPWVYLGFYRRLFEHVTFQPVWQNLPPGGVYHCRSVKATSTH